MWQLTTFFIRGISPRPQMMNNMLSDWLGNSPTRLFVSNIRCDSSPRSTCTVLIKSLCTPHYTLRIQVLKLVIFHINSFCLLGSYSRRQRRYFSAGPKPLFSKDRYESTKYGSYHLKNQKYTKSQLVWELFWLLRFYDFVNLLINIFIL